ncbi:caspase family protein [Acidovorax sp. LjRoot66]|uniref:caspase family protein n=1 Tax=Acidovorax sp. LjRoot66 TaxID=3342334 RepID=UPI003ED0CB23
MTDFRFIYKNRYEIGRALVIGIDRYKRVPNLGYAVSDALAIKEALINDLGFDDSKITLLTDEAATRDAILKAYLRFAKYDVNLDDKIVVFFAGHGHTLTGRRGEVGYLVPHDADLDDISTCIRWDDLTKNVDLIRAKHILFIMDACYGGLALVRTASAGSSRFLKDMMLRTSRQVLTAGKANQVVSDSGGPIPNHSVFTGHLIEAIQGKALTPEGFLTASGVMSYVYGRVASDKDSNQTPHFGHIDGDGDMVLKAPGLDVLEESDTKDIDLLVSIPFSDGLDEIDSIDVRVEEAKKLLASESGSIGLHDLLSDQVRRFLASTADDSFAPSTTFTQEEFESRITRYEAAARNISILLACVSQWGRAHHLLTLQKCLARSGDRLESVSGLSVWLDLRWYPLLIELYCCGIAAIDASRYDSLAAIFRTQLPNSDLHREHGTFIEAASSAILAFNRSNILKRIPGQEEKYTPLSDHFLKILQPDLDDALFLGKNYEVAFDTFEVYFALCSADVRLAKEGTPWGPIGRFGWKQAPLIRVIEEAKAFQGNWLPLKSGLFGGDFARFLKVADALLRDLRGLHWH